ncbi:MAG: hypothetical protein VYD12_19340 [Pseudomonadota bacterium]|nr:hypothetical protein [Pseudomonadota bacterium]
MHYIPTLNDTFVTDDNQRVKIIHTDQQRVLLAPLINSVDEGDILLPAESFREQLRTGNLRLLTSRNETIEQYSDYQVKEADKRKPFLAEMERLYNLGMPPTASATLKQVKQNVEDKHHIAKKKHGDSTLCRWWKDYKDADFNLEASIKDRKIQTKRLNPASEVFLNKHLSNVWAKGNAENIAGGYRQYVKHAHQAIEENSAIQVVCESTFRNRLSDLNQFSLVAQSGNYSEITKALRTLCKKIHLSRALERVEMDRLSLNLALIGEDGKPTDNVSIYIAIDCYSRYPISVTYEIGTSEDTVGVLRSLKRIITDSNQQLPAFGLPEEVVVDNGPGYSSEAFRHVTKRLNISLTKTPSNQPWRKPFVESFNNTLRREFFEGASFTLPDGSEVLGIPGYFPKRTQTSLKPPTEESIKNAARITISDFEKQLLLYLHHYVNSAHSSLAGKTPQQVWDESIALHPQPAIMDNLIHSAFHCFESKVKLSSRGTVQVDNQVFSDTQLKQLYLNAKTLDKKQDLSVYVQRDPDDARYVTVIATFESLASEVIVENAPNRALKNDELTCPVSFEQLNVGNAGRKRRDIYFGELDTHMKPKRQKRSTGKIVQSANKNLNKGLSADERIKQSNNLYNERKVTNKRREETASSSISTKHSSSKAARQSYKQHDFWNEDAV